ncbi:MAG TPA: GNAT family N-acetyltransferase [Chloroflexota bacterium]|nr:GNAT family N-acetyltransferase [Chloroflexota bacterium]
MDVPSIRSARLELVSMSPAFLRASLEGRHAEAEAMIGAGLPPDWPGDRARTVRRRLDELTVNPAAQPWLLRAIVLREPERRMVGHINFHDPPGPERKVEVGYSIWPEYRRQGYALEAVEALFGWASREHGIRQFVASVGPWNEASLGLVRKMGFVQTGSRWDDEDGEELVFELERGVQAGPACTPDP